MRETMFRNRSNDNKNNSSNNESDRNEEMSKLKMIIKNLQVENRTLVQDMEDQKLAFEARHSSMMAVLQQQTEEHKSKIDKEQEEQNEPAPPPPPPPRRSPEEIGLKVKHETLLAAHEKTREELNDLKSLLNESRARLDKINKLYEELLESSNAMEKDLSSEKSKSKKNVKEFNALKQEHEAMINQSKILENELDDIKIKYNESKEDNNKTILELRENLATIENELIEKKERVIRAEESTNKMTDRINEMETEMNRLKESEENARKMHEKSQGQTNAAKKKVASIRKDISKIFRVCEAKTLDDIVKIVKERREFQVQLTMAKAEKRAAEDELTAYKDALKRQLIDNVKPEKRSVLDRLRKRSPSSGKKNRNKNNNNNNGNINDIGSLPSYTVTDLQNLANNLMEKLDERDERMKLKEFEKRQLFERIIELETKLKISTQQGRDSRSTSVVDDDDVDDGGDGKVASNDGQT